MPPTQGLAVVNEFKKPKMNKENLLLELGKAIQVDGRVNVDRYCRVVELVETYLSINYGKPIVSGALPCPLCNGTGKYIEGINVSKYYEDDGNDR